MTFSPNKSACQEHVDPPPAEKQIISRKEALAVGARKYFTGKACKRGHIAERHAIGGHTWRCVVCVREQNRQFSKGYYRRHKDKFKSYSHANYIRNREKNTERNILWRKRNPEKIKAYSERWRTSNRAQHRKMCLLWHKNNLEKSRAKARERRALKKGARGTHTAEDIARIIKQQNCKCAYCRKKIVNRRYQVDHIIPIFKGGSNVPSNLQVLCPKCNAEKGAKDPLDHARRLGLLL